MPPLPVLSAREIIRVLERAGWAQTRQSGSHAIFRRRDGSGRVMVPIHPGDLVPGTLRGILNQAEMTVDELNELRR